MDLRSTYFQNWFGFFTYEESNEETKQEIKVDFTLKINIEGNSFTGTSFDKESINCFDNPAKIKGFMDNEKISFVMKYPYHYFTDKYGQIQTDKNSEHPDIQYLGFFNKEKNQVEGTWEMTLYSESYLDGFLEEVISGRFEMSLKI